MSALQYIFQAFLKAAILGLVMSLAWFGLSPIASPLQEITLYYMNQTLFLFFPYQTLLVISQTAVTVSSTFVIVWMLDPMRPIFPRIVATAPQSEEDAQAQVNAALQDIAASRVSEEEKLYKEAFDTDDFSDLI